MYIVNQGTKDGLKTQATKPGTLKAPDQTHQAA